MNAILRPVSSTAHAKRYLLPCGHGELPIETAEGVHTCPVCGAPAMLERVMTPTYCARNLLPNELQVLADLDPDDVAAAPPGDVAFLVRGFPETAQKPAPAGYRWGWFEWACIALGIAVMIASISYSLTIGAVS